MKQVPKTLLYFLLYILALIPLSSAFAQDNEASSEAELDEVSVEETTPNEMTVREFNFNAAEPVFSFSPFNYPDQKIALGKDTDIQPARINNGIAGIITGLVLLAFFIFLILKVKSVFLRLLLGGFGLVVLAAAAYLFLLLDVYAKISPPKAMARATERLAALSKAFNIVWMDDLTIKDDNYRLGMVYSRKELLVVDYEENKGWLIPKGQIAAVIAHPDSTIQGAENVATVFTKDAKKGINPIQNLVISLKEGNVPSKIWLQYQDDFSKYDAVTLIESFILAWEENIAQ